MGDGGYGGPIFTESLHRCFGSWRAPIYGRSAAAPGCLRQEQGDHPRPTPALQWVAVDPADFSQPVGLVGVGADDADRLALEAFVVENAELEHLETHIARFNIFESLGVVRQELRHSDFLAFLLDPRQTHGLGDLFVKRLLQRVLRYGHPAPVSFSAVDLDAWNLTDLVVRREWEGIDILLADERHKFAVVVENKIDSGEHSDQLTRYYATVRQTWPAWQAFGLFLTPDGDPPSHESYLPISYGVVCELVEGTASASGQTVGPDVLILMEHYVQTLRRHIVSESEIALLCRQIYSRHQRALDLIFEHRPDLQGQIQQYLLELITSSGMKVDNASKQWVTFLPDAWDVPQLLGASGWTPSRRMLLFQFWNPPQRLQLSLVIGPGPERIRRSLFDFMLDNQPPFKPSRRVLSRMWNTVWQRTILSADVYEGASRGDLEQRIAQQWETFIGEDYSRLYNALGTILPVLPQVPA